MCLKAKYVVPPNRRLPCILVASRKLRLELTYNSNEPRTVPAIALEQTDPRHTSSFLIRSAEATNPPNQNSIVVISALSMAHLFASFPKYCGARTV